MSSMTGEAFPVRVLGDLSCDKVGLNKKEGEEKSTLTRLLFSSFFTRDIQRYTTIDLKMKAEIIFHFFPFFHQIQNRSHIIVNFITIC